MKTIVRVLHLLAGDARAPLNLSKAADFVHLVRAGHVELSELRPLELNVLTLCPPYDYEVRAAVEQLAPLELPKVGIGDQEWSELDLHVTPVIQSRDLRTILELLILNRSANREPAIICPLENKRECLGGATDFVVNLIEHLLSLRIPGYRERADRVVEACVWIGNHLCLPPAELKNLTYAARLREVGKIGLPDRILFAPRKARTEQEQSVYNQYAPLGARVLREVPTLREAANTVEHQLENFDGSGPAGHMANQIPLGSRILRVAGAFAMISAEDPAGSKRAVIDALEQKRGSWYDPLLVKLVTNLCQMEGDDADMSTTQRVRIGDLEEGMVLAEDVWSRTGMKILSKGTRLTAHMLNVMYQYPLDPALKSILVMR